MSQKPVFKTRTQLVEEAIRTQILKGELKTGQPLRQDALAKSSMSAEFLCVKH